jgi:hypothetical protein
MKKIGSIRVLPPFAIALALSACASRGPTADTLMALPQEQVLEVRYEAEVPAALAYKNLLERANRCWQDRSHVLHAESFSSKVGSARMSLRQAGRGFGPTATQLVIDVARIGENTSRIVSRSLVADDARERDLRNLQLWAEGKAADCG